ncbi:MAG: integral rane sensor signal transduction histidine kinase, partial [Thermoleophilia bacterium]|nr:integral rane sensor signal transduction histidine kinase [Thermoleophilia bacterium]
APRCTRRDEDEGVIVSLRARLGALAALLVLGGLIAGGVAAWAVANDVIAHDARVAVVVGTTTISVLLVLGGVVLVHRALRPFLGLVRASREIAQGRHPDEALNSISLNGELREIADGMRTLALRLREIDATDRRFLMSISHELRTPLTAITGHAQAIEDFADDPEMRGQSVQVIRKEAERLERLVEDIVDLARLRSNRFTTVTETVWLDELGEHLLAIFDGSSPDAETAPGASRVNVIGDFQHVMLHSDGHRILQILRNLVGNGLRYATTSVRVTGQRTGGHVRLVVVNDGEPINELQRDRIFEPFVGTKREGGLGLGLAIGRELAWALGGNLRCLDREDGAEFELLLPLEPPDFDR